MTTEDSPSPPWFTPGERRWALEDAEVEWPRHLAHMTDGRWHDECQFCRRRRAYSGNGSAVPLTAGRVWRERKAGKFPESQWYGGYVV